MAEPVVTFYDPRRVEQLRRKGITADRQARGALTALPNATAGATEPRTALEMVEECARLRAEVERLRQENRQLTDEVTRLTRLTGHAPGRAQDQAWRREESSPDDAVTRFSLLELDL